MAVCRHRPTGPTPEDGTRNPPRNGNYRSILKDEKIYTSKKSSTPGKPFLCHRVYTYGSPIYMLTDKGSKLKAKLFPPVCNILGVKNYFTTPYHPQTNGNVERVRKTILQLIGYYMEEHQAGWDEFVQPLTYDYNLQGQGSTGALPFHLVLLRHPPGKLLRGQLSSNHSGACDSSRTPAEVKRATLMKLRKTL